MRSCRRALLVCALVVSIAGAGNAAAQRNRRAQSAADQAAPAASDAPKESATKLEGSVLLEFTIATDGTTKDIVVVESSPPGVFDQAAAQALAKWRYNPKIENGQPVE